MTIAARFLSSQLIHSYVLGTYQGTRLPGTMLGGRQGPNFEGLWRETMQMSQMNTTQHSVTCTTKKINEDAVITSSGGSEREGRGAALA